MPTTCRLELSSRHVSWTGHTEPAFAPAAVCSPALTPPETLLRSTTAVETPGDRTSGKLTATNDQTGITGYRL
jgi:hypothetical protein